MAEYRFPNGTRCLLCPRTEIDRAHIKTRGAGAKWNFWEVMPLCREHHTQQGKIGVVTFFKRFPPVRRYLEGMGWRLEDVVGKETLVHNMEMMN